MTDSSSEGRKPIPGYPSHTDATRLYGEEMAADPKEWYREIRRKHGTVAPVLLEGDVPAWFVQGYREFYHVTGNPQIFGRDCRRWNLWDSIPEDWPLMPYVGWTPSVMFTEGAEHQRRASAISDALDAVDRTELAVICERTADQLIDQFSGRGEADLVADYADKMPVSVLARLIGMPEADIPDMIRNVADSLDEGPQALEAHQRVQARMQALVEERRERPRPDVPSRLLAHPSQLTVEEIVIDLLVIMVAGQQLTTSWIGNTLRLMLINDDFSIVLQGGRSSVAQALNEVLWEDTPTQNYVGRWAVCDCELGGRRIREGDLLVLGHSSANADPLVRPDSQADFGVNRAHVSFGHGEHSCPYPAPEFCETISRTAIEVLLDRLPDVEVAVKPDELQWRPSIWVRGVLALPVTFSPIGPISRRLA